MTKKFSKAAVTGLALAAGMMFGAAADAATATYVATHNFTSTNRAGMTIPGGVFGQASSDVFNFSDIQNLFNYGTITSFFITMTYSETADTKKESWSGSILGGHADVAGPTFALIDDDRQKPIDVFVTSGSPVVTSGLAFDAAVADKYLTVHFDDSINPKPTKNDPHPVDRDKFLISQIVLTVNYTPVPVPASGLLLLGGLGGLAALRRRKSV